MASMEPRTHARGNLRTHSGASGNVLRFNGATHSRAWKRVCVPSLPLLLLALQWSHALTRVETRGTSRAKIVCSCFNGATHSRAWKHEIRTRGPCSRGCFNGATHSRAWKQPEFTPEARKKWRLQWSHALTRVETPVPTGPVRRVRSLQWSHALTRVETALVPNSAKTIVTVALASA